jgi:hypothetical protein
MKGHLDIVLLLLEKRANANLADQVPAPTTTSSRAFLSAVIQHSTHQPHSHIARPFCHRILHFSCFGLFRVHFAHRIAAHNTFCTHLKKK